MPTYEQLKLQNQLCFPLYAAAKEVVRLYTPHLDPLGLTYTQYIVLLVLWENAEASVGELGKRLYLDSGTLTPLLKKLEAKGLIKRQRSTADERVVLVSLTAAGLDLREQAAAIPAKVGACISLDQGDAAQLYTLLYKSLDALTGE
jgi:DNA-binding MarR family transcriptional regulator